MFESFASHSQQYISTFLAENSIILKTGAEHNLFACKNEQIKCIGCYIFLCVFLEIKFLCFFSAQRELRDLRFVGAFYALVSPPLPSTHLLPLVKAPGFLPHLPSNKIYLAWFFFQYECSSASFLRENRDAFSTETCDVLVFAS